MSVLPDIKTFTMILNHYYEKEPNMLILHQLFLISQHLTYDEEIGIREISNFLRKLLLDYNLDFRNALEENFARQIELFPSNTNNIEENELHSNDNSAQRKILLENFTTNDPKDKFLDYNISKYRHMEIKFDNAILPANRKIILSLDDLLDFAMKILLKIYYKESQKLSLFIMELVSDLKDLISTGNPEENEVSELKKREAEIIKEIKEKIAEIEALKENLNKKKEKHALDTTNQIFRLEKELDNLDEELITIKNEEAAIYLRVLKLCVFLVKYCKNSSQCNFFK